MIAKMFKKIHTEIREENKLDVAEKRREMEELRRETVQLSRLETSIRAYKTNLSQKMCKLRI
jgi:hypothetical protein